MNKSLVAAAALVSVAGSSLAAPPAWKFQHISGLPFEETLLGIAEVPLPRGGYIATGWQRSVAGGPADIVVVRISENGSLIWRRQIGVAANNEIGISVVPTQDGGFAVAGEANGVGAGLGTFVLKLNGLGNTLWGRVYFGAPFAPGIQSARIIEMRNGNLAVASRYQNGGAVLSTIFQLTGAGAPVWQWGYPDTRYGNTQQGTLLDIVEEPAPAGAASRLIAVGFTQRTAGANREALAVAVNPVTGLPLFAAVYTPATVYDAHFNSITPLLPFQAPAGIGFGFAGRYTAFAGLPDGSLLMRVDPGLLGLFAPPAAYPNFQVGRSALDWDSQPQILGEFTLGGTEPRPAGAPGDASLIRTDPTGNPLFQWFYGGPANDEALAMERTRNDIGFVLAGNTASFNVAPPPDLYVIKTDANGMSGCNEVRQQRPRPDIPPAPLPISVTNLGLQSTIFNPPNVPLTTPQRVKCFTCPADLNQDGVVDFNDLLEFLNIYNANDPDADVNNDGVVDFNDLLEFLNLYNAPCP